MDFTYYGPDDARLHLDDESGALIDISALVQNIGDIMPDAAIAEGSQGFGKAWGEIIPIGVRTGAEIPIEMWLTSADSNADAGTIERIGSRKMLQNTAETPRSTTRTLRAIYGAPAGVTAASTTLSAAGSRGDRTLTVTASADFAVGDYADVNGEAYRITAKPTGTSITLHRGLLKAASNGADVTKITEMFAETEVHVRQAGVPLARDNATMIKGALRPSGEIVQN